MRTLALLLMMLAAPAAAQTASERVFRLAELAPSAASLEITREETLPELAKLGFRDGRNLVLEERAGEPDRMKRRAFIALLGIVPAAWPVRAIAQRVAGSVRQIGLLSPQSVTSAAPLLAALRRGLRDLGWIEGRNIEFAVRYADGVMDRLAELAAELVRQNVDVIVAGSNLGALAAKRATSTIPIVMVTTGDPIAGGLIDSLARPGGNVTGVTAIAQELSAKRLELLKEAVPNIGRVAVLTNPDSPYTALFLKDAGRAAQSVGVELQILEAHSPSEFDAAFTAMGGGSVQALMVLADIMFNTEHARIVELAAKSRLPAVYWERTYVSAGGLMFYGAGLSDMYGHAATHVDKILRGAKPADLPVEQPTKFELVVNLKTAKTIGIEIPQSILLRADEVIE
ncbi:MAG TPA: ABC transporter substrate-binding protein [Xanthobacteraceae bacterium]